MADIVETISKTETSVEGVKKILVDMPGRYPGYDIGIASITELPNGLYEVNVPVIKLEIPNEVPKQVYVTSVNSRDELDGKLADIEGRYKGWTTAKPEFHVFKTGQILIQIPMTRGPQKTNPYTR